MIDLNSTVKQRDDLEGTDLNGELVMMNMEKGKYYSLNEVAKEIWEKVKEPISVLDLIKKLMEEYDIENTECTETVMKFLGRMKDEELINIL